MSVGKSEKLKDHISPLLSAMRDFSDQSVQRELEKILVPECQIKMCFPFGTIKGTENYFGTAYKLIRSTEIIFCSFYRSKRKTHLNLTFWN